MRIRTHRPRASVGLILAVASLAAAVALHAVPALADHCSGDGDIYQGGGEVVGECHGDDPGRPGSTSVHELWNIYCADVGPYQEGDEVAFYEVAPVDPDEIELFGLDPTGEYVWYDVICWHDGRGEGDYSIIVEITPPVPPEVIRDRATARLEPPPPDPATSPPSAQQTYVKIPTWLWLEAAAWTPVEVSETQGLVTVTVRATPTGALWLMGDGGEVYCSGPGIAWYSGAPEDATDCSYTYRHSSYGEPDGRFRASVTVTWEFEWWINDVPQGVFGSVELTTPFELAVAEIQAVETGG